MLAVDRRTFLGGAIAQTLVPSVASPAQPCTETSTELAQTPNFVIRDGDVDILEFAFIRMFYIKHVRFQAIKDAFLNHNVQPRDFWVNNLLPLLEKHRPFIESQRKERGLRVDKDWDNCDCLEDCLDILALLIAAGNAGALHREYQLDIEDVNFLDRIDVPDIKPKLLAGITPCYS